MSDERMQAVLVGIMLASTSVVLTTAGGELENVLGFMAGVVGLGLVVMGALDV